MNDLLFSTLRTVNVARCESTFDPLSAWSPTDWACAMAGETGEACNQVKKLRRLDNVEDADAQRKAIIENIGKELADAVIYADLLAARLGIDLGAAVRATFNEVSERVGSSIRLPTDAPEEL